MFDIEFWKSENEEKFADALKDLVEHGYSEQEAKEMLEGLYYAVASEYGG